jgi:phage-related protein
VSPTHKPLVFLSGATIKTPPLTAAARGEVGYLLRQLQAGESLALPRSRPMPSIGARCHELRVQDETVTWRLVYRIDPKAIVVVDVFTKNTQATPRVVIDKCQSAFAHSIKAGDPQTSLEALLRALIVLGATPTLKVA